MTELETYRTALLGLRALVVKGLISGPYLEDYRDPKTEACLCGVATLFVAAGLRERGITRTTDPALLRFLIDHSDWWQFDDSAILGWNEQSLRGDNSPAACAERYRVVRAHVESRLAELEAEAQAAK